MIVVILTGTAHEGEEYRKVANLASADVIIPRTSRALDGLRLTDADLIVEFPSFEAHPQHDEVYAVLRRCLKKTRATTPWERITG